MKKYCDIVLGDTADDHLYELEVSAFGSAAPRFKIEVFANSRVKAAAIATNNQYIVHSVNMVG